LGMPSERTNNFPESGRGLGHMTPTIFGSTVGYPSDSLASCFSSSEPQAVGPIFALNTSYDVVLRKEVPFGGEKN